MGDILITAPADEPVTVAEFRAWLRDPADSDTVLARLIKAARELVEQETGLALIAQTRDLTLDAWPSGGDGLGWWDGVKEGAITSAAPRHVELPRAPLSSIASVKIYDESGGYVVWDAASYFADTGSQPGRLVLSSGAIWPVTTRAAAGIVIRYVAGWPNAAAVPSALSTAVLQIAAHWYENRELTSIDGPQKVPMMASRILQKYRIARL